MPIKFRQIILEPTIALQAHIYSHVGFRVPITVALPRYLFTELAIEVEASQVLEVEHPKLQIWPDIVFVPQAEYRL